MTTEQADRQHTIDRILGETEWLTPARMAELPLLKWKRERRIFCVELDGTRCYPRYQFDASFQPLPIISEILSDFKSEEDAWKIAAWLHFPNGYINVETPAGRQPAAPHQALDRRDDILRALHARTGTYVA